MAGPLPGGIEDAPSAAQPPPQPSADAPSGQPSTGRRYCFKRVVTRGFSPSSPGQDSSDDDVFMSPKKPRANIPPVCIRASPRLKQQASAAAVTRNSKSSFSPPPNPAKEQHQHPTRIRKGTHTVSRESSPDQDRGRKRRASHQPARQPSPPAINRRNKLNIRCNPEAVLAAIQVMNNEQRAEVARYGFSCFLDMVLNAVESRGLLRWLMDHTSPTDMTIRAGPSKDLKITKDVVKLILGIPSSGGSLHQYSWAERKVLASQFRATLGIGKEEISIAYLRDRVATGGVDQLTMRCFFLIVINRLLFPSASWAITNRDIEMTEQMDRLAEIDWCQLVFNDLCDSVTSWHSQKEVTAARTIYGCSVVILIYYLDNLSHNRSPADRFGTPRIRFFDKTVIAELSKADSKHLHGSPTTYGHCHFRSSSDTCYVQPPNDNPGPSDSSIYIPRLIDLLSAKLLLLPHWLRAKFSETIKAHDAETDKYCVSVQRAHELLRQNQSKLADFWAETIDDVLRAQATSDPDSSGPHSHGTHEDQDQGSGSDEGSDHPSPGNPASGMTSPLPTQLPPASQLTDSQAEFFNTKFFELQQQRLRAHSYQSPTKPETLPGNKSKMPMSWPLEDDSLAAANQSMSQLNTSSFFMEFLNIFSSPVPEPRQSLDDLPIFDKTPQSKVDSLKRTTIDLGQSKSTKHFVDVQTPSGQIRETRSNTPGPPPKLPLRGKLRHDTAKRLRDLLCDETSGLHMKVLMQFGSRVYTGLQIAQSFQDGHPLDICFMQSYVQCLRDDDSTLPSPQKFNRSIFTPTVSVTLDCEAMHAKKHNPDPFDEQSLVHSVDTLLPSDEALQHCKIIMLPMLHRGHWSLYVINFWRCTIDIVDPNPYGPPLHGNCWKDFHADTIKWRGMRYSFWKLAVKRLALAIQAARPNSPLPNFTNFALKLCGDCPTMSPGSNDSAFYVMLFLIKYHCKEGYIMATIEPHNSYQIRCEVLHYLLFHPSNEVQPMPHEVSTLRCY